MQTPYLFLLRCFLLVMDILLVNTVFVLALGMVTTWNFYLLPGFFTQIIWVTNLLWFMSAAFFGLYRTSTIVQPLRVYRATWKTAVGHVVLLIVYLVFARETRLSAAFMGLFYALMALAFLLSRFVATLLEEMITRYFPVNRVAVLGKSGTCLRLAAYFEKNQNYKFEGFLPDQDGKSFVAADGSTVPLNCREIDAAARRGIKNVFVALTPDRLTEAPYLIREAEKACVRLRFIPDLSAALPSRFSVSHIGDLPVISLRNEPLENINNRFKKRLFDILFSTFVILFVLSWLVPVIAIIIKIQSPGPVFFRQLRSGKNNKPFYCYKLRSMHVNAESNKKQADKNDSRITPIGRFLRKTSIDELPQFYNVLLGNMSIVGPRPHMLVHTRMYSALIDRYMVRHFLKPGITGWAQVNGYRGETKDTRLMEKRVEHDIWYLENWSLMLDVKIVFMTVAQMVKGDPHAY